MREADIQRQILDYLTLKGIFHYRQNSGAFRRDDHFYRMGVAGAPDIICVVGGRYIGIEVKAPGGRNSPSQNLPPRSTRTNYRWRPVGEGTAASRRACGTPSK